MVGEEKYILALSPCSGSLARVTFSFPKYSEFYKNFYSDYYFTFVAVLKNYIFYVPPN